jgi:hypothetical protein
MRAESGLGGVVTAVMSGPGDIALDVAARPVAELTGTVRGVGPRWAGTAVSTLSQPGILPVRDETIIVGHVGSIDRVESVDGAPEAITSVNGAGIPIVVVMNRSGVARGHAASRLCADNRSRPLSPGLT